MIRANENPTIAGTRRRDMDHPRRFAKAREARQPFDNAVRTMRGTSRMLSARSDPAYQKSRRTGLVSDREEVGKTARDARPRPEAGVLWRRDTPEEAEAVVGAAPEPTADGSLRTRDGLKGCTKSRSQAGSRRRSIRGIIAMENPSRFPPRAGPFFRDPAPMSLGPRCSGR